MISAIIIGVGIARAMLPEVRLVEPNSIAASTVARIGVLAWMVLVGASGVFGLVGWEALALVAFGIGSQHSFDVVRLELIHRDRFARACAHDVGWLVVLCVLGQMADTPRTVLMVWSVSAAAASLFPLMLRAVPAPDCPTSWLRVRVVAGDLVVVYLVSGMIVQAIAGAVAAIDTVTAGAMRAALSLVAPARLAIQGLRLTGLATLRSSARVVDAWKMSTRTSMFVAIYLAVLALALLLGALRSVGLEPSGVMVAALLAVGLDRLAVAGGIGAATLQRAFGETAPVRNATMAGGMLTAVVAIPFFAMSWPLGVVMALAIGSVFQTFLLWRGVRLSVVCGRLQRCGVS